MSISPLLEGFQELRHPRPEGDGRKRDRWTRSFEQFVQTVERVAQSAKTGQCLPQRLQQALERRIEKIAANTTDPTLQRSIRTAQKHLQETHTCLPAYRPIPTKCESLPTIQVLSPQGVKGWATALLALFGNITSYHVCSTPIISPEESRALTLGPDTCPVRLIPITSFKEQCVEAPPGTVQNFLETSLQEGASSLSPSAQASFEKVLKSANLDDKQLRTLWRNVANLRLWGDWPFWLAHLQRFPDHIAQLATPLQLEEQQFLEHQVHLRNEFDLSSTQKTSDRIHEFIKLFSSLENLQPLGGHSYLLRVVGYHTMVRLLDLTDAALRKFVLEPASFKNRSQVQNLLESYLHMAITWQQAFVDPKMRYVFKGDTQVSLERYAEDLWESIQLYLASDAIDLVPHLLSELAELRQTAFMAASSMVGQVGHPKELAESHLPKGLKSIMSTLQQHGLQHLATTSHESTLRVDYQQPLYWDSSRMRLEHDLRNHRTYFLGQVFGPTQQDRNTLEAGVDGFSHGMESVRAPVVDASQVSVAWAITPKTAERVYEKFLQLTALFHGKEAPNSANLQAPRPTARLRRRSRPVH